MPAPCYLFFLISRLSSGLVLLIYLSRWDFSLWDTSPAVFVRGLQSVVASAFLFPMQVLQPEVGNRAD